MTEVAVVILNYNGRKFLQQFLPSVIQHSGDAKIYVADNGSTDDSIDFLEKEFSAVEIIKINDNRGYCGGYNFALSKIDAEYFILLNSDIEVTERWIDPIIELMKGNPLIAAAQPKILSFTEKEKFEYAGAAGGFIDILGYPFCRGRIFNNLENDKGQYNDTREVFWATGACLFVRGSVFKQIGGLDEDFFAHMEEIDLCWRMQRANYLIYYCGESKVYHVGGGTLSKSNPRKTYLNFKNGLSLIFKNFPSASLLWKFPFRLMLDWAAACLFLIRGQVNDSVAVLQAHYQFFFTIKIELKKRKDIRMSLPTYEVHHQVKTLLPFQYFILGNKTYEEITS
jgi:GT2 family glycosyltransferase